MYENQMECAFPGMKADSGFDRVESYPAGVAVPFGRVVVTNPAGPAAVSPVDNQPAFLPAAIADAVARGIAVHSHTVGNDGYILTDCISVMTKGLIWAEAAAVTAITRDSAVRYNAAGQLVPTGGTVLRNAVVRGPVVALADGKFIALVELDAPTFVAPA